MIAPVRGCSSVVERQLPKLNVVGSIPIARSNIAMSSANEAWVVIGPRFATVA